MVVYFYSGVAGGDTFDGSAELQGRIFSNKEYDILRDVIYTKVADMLGCDVSTVVLTSLNRL